MMRTPSRTAMDGAIALIATLLVIQMWLLTATLETYLAGHSEPIGPAAIISGVIFAVCAGLYLFIRRIDAEERSRSASSPGVGMKDSAPLPHPGDHTNSAD